MSHLGTPSRRETSHSRATSEQAVQRAVCQHLRQRGAAGLRLVAHAQRWPSQPH